MRYAQMVMGPAGSGKSTFCSVMFNHAEMTKRIINVVNLDPACEFFDYEPLLDIRELINVDDVMQDEDLRLGPNSSLVFCLEYLIKNPEWLQEHLTDTSDDDYFIFDCPGQIELYTHMDVMKRFTELLEALDFRICGVYLIESQFMVETHKFFSGLFSALSAMVNLEIPYVCVLSKMDLLNQAGKRRINEFIENCAESLLDSSVETLNNPKFDALSRAIAKVVDGFALVRLHPLNVKNEESVADLLFLIDNAIQYGEDLDVKTNDFDEANGDPE